MVNSRAKGLGAEQAAARYFREQGPPWQEARRAVAAGWSNGSTSSPDRGDLAGLPGLCVQVKNLAKPLTGKALLDVWAATEVQALNAGGLMPLILEKRQGSANVGRWHVHLACRDFVRIVAGRHAWMPRSYTVRVELGPLIDDLRSYSTEFGVASR